jgi:glycosidase
MPPELLKQEYLKRGSDGFYIDAVPPLDKYEKKAAN